MGTEAGGREVRVKPGTEVGDLIEKLEAFKRKGVAGGKPVALSCAQGRGKEAT